MAKKSSMTFVEDFAFYEQLWNYYASIANLLNNAVPLQR